MGITQHKNGVDNVYSIGNTALMTGNIDRIALKSHNTVGLLLLKEFQFLLVPHLNKYL
jgi:hypothetical protein